MGARSYGHYCSIAKALDVVGERWTLLIVRELMVGAQRYSDLLAAIPGVSTDMLATRLKDMERDGLIQRRTLRPPAASTVYELTPVGRGLERLLVELSRWGVRLMGERGDADFRIQWLRFMLRAMLRPDHVQGPPLLIRFEVEGERFVAQIADGKVVTSLDVDAQPELDVEAPVDVEIVASVEVLAAMASDPRTIEPAVARGELTIGGSRQALKRMRSVLGFDP